MSDPPADTTANRKRRHRRRVADHIPFQVYHHDLVSSMARDHPVLIHAVNMATILQLVQRLSADQTETPPSFGMTLGRALLGV